LLYSYVEGFRILAELGLPSVNLKKGYVMNSIAVGAVAGAVVGGLGSIIYDVSTDQEVDFKSAGKFAALGSVIGAAAGFVVGGNAAAVKEVAKGSVEQLSPKDFVRCGEIAKQFNVSTQEVVSAAKSAGVYGEAGFSMPLGGAFRAESYTYLSNSYGYTKEAITLMAKFL